MLTEKTFVNCKTREQRLAVLYVLYAKGYKWFNQDTSLTPDGIDERFRYESFPVVAVTPEEKIIELYSRTQRLSIQFAGFTEDNLISAEQLEVLLFSEKKPLW